MEQGSDAYDASKDTRTVITVRVVCHTMGLIDPSATTSQNHWSIYLLINNEQSIRLNMRADPGYIDGILDVTRHNYVVSNSTLQYWDFQAVPNVPVWYFNNLLFTYRRNQYSMSGGGSGCRFWIYTIICDFVNMNYLEDKNAAGNLWPHLLYQYGPDTKINLPMVEGTFE